MRAPRNGSRLDWSESAFEELLGRPSMPLDVDGAELAGKRVMVTGAGGSIGSSISVDRLARKVIRMHGLVPDRDIEVVYTGLRAGEKPQGELAGKGEQAVHTDDPRISKLVARKAARGALDAQVDGLVEDAIEMDGNAIRRRLKRLVPEYEPPRSGAGSGRAQWQAS